MKNNIPWWRTNFAQNELNRIIHSFNHENISQGPVTALFEKAIGEAIEVDHVIATSSGSSALLMALMAIGIGPGDEVILPNRTWISTAHAVSILGAKVVVVDVEFDRPIIDVSLIEAKINSNTKAIIPVHMNGRSANMHNIIKLAKKYNIKVIEDAAQAFYSKGSGSYLGTIGDIGCFSLSNAKIISSGQGGFAVTKNKYLANKMRAIRTQGVENVKDPKKWAQLGFNFRYTDILASIAIEQLKKIKERKRILVNLYNDYCENFNGTEFKIIPVNLASGEIPIYTEFLISNRDKWISRLKEVNIDTRPFYPSINDARYLNIKKEKFNRSLNFHRHGIYFPSGPGQEKNVASKVLTSILKLKK